MPLIKWPYRAEGMGSVLTGDAVASGIRFSVLDAVLAVVRVGTVPASRRFWPLTRTRGVLLSLAAAIASPWGGSERTRRFGWCLARVSVPRGGAAGPGEHVLSLLEMPTGTGTGRQPVSGMVGESHSAAANRLGTGARGFAFGFESITFRVQRRRGSGEGCWCAMTRSFVGCGVSGSVCTGRGGGAAWLALRVVAASSNKPLPILPMRARVVARRWTMDEAAHCLCFAL